jgi:hypothetical protein
MIKKLFFTAAQPPGTAYAADSSLDLLVMYPINFQYTDQYNVGGIKVVTCVGEPMGDAGITAVFYP